MYVGETLSNIVGKNIFQLFWREKGLKLDDVFSSGATLRQLLHGRLELGARIGLLHNRSNLKFLILKIINILSNFK
jgi:hypothetical protein